MTLTNNGLKRVLGWLRNIQQGQCALRSDVEMARLAADEIERLRAEVEQWEAAAFPFETGPDKLSGKSLQSILLSCPTDESLYLLAKEVIALRAEVERLNEPYVCQGCAEYKFEMEEKDRRIEELEQLHRLLQEAVDVVSGHIEDGDKLDSFTVQPWKHALDGRSER